MGRGHLRSTDRPQPALGEAPLRLSRGLILVALLALLAAGLWGRGPSPLEAQGLQEDQRAKGQGPAPGQPTLEARLGRLKAELEGELAGVKEQQMVTALALKYASQAWALAAEAQALENSPWSAAERIEWLSQAWRDKAAPRSSRETAALKLYFESLVSLCLSHAQRAQANWAYAEIGSLIGESAQRYQFHSEKNAQEAEARVVWSNRLIAIAPLLIRLQAQGQLQATEELLSHLVEKAKEIAERRDVHYQGRMELLFLNNAKGLAMTHFLLAKAAPSPLTEEAQGLEEAWREQLLAADNSLADQISLTWLTTAQLSFPLAFWQAGPAGP